MSKVGGGDSKNTLYCSFCGKSQHEVRKLIAGPTVFICDECVELCMDIIREEHKTTLVKCRDGVPGPKDICKVLDDYESDRDTPSAYSPSRCTTITSDSPTAPRTMTLSSRSRTSCWWARPVPARRSWRRRSRASSTCPSPWRTPPHSPRRAMSAK